MTFAIILIFFCWIQDFYGGWRDWDLQGWDRSRGRVWGRVWEDMVVKVE